MILRPSVGGKVDDGVVHEVDQGEGGEQADAMMLLLFALGQHDALSEVQNQLRPEEMLFAFLDDICVVCRVERVDVVHTLLQNALLGVCDFFGRSYLAVDGARVWRGGLGNRGERTWHQNVGDTGHPDTRPHSGRTPDTRTPGHTQAGHQTPDTGPHSGRTPDSGHRIPGHT